MTKTETRELGKTGEKVSVMGMGTWNMGDGNQRDLKEQLEALLRGIELGMTLIDTAEAYGYGKSETLVGAAIRERRDEVFVATKVSPENFHYEDVLRSCEASLQRLGVRFIDLYQLHWPNPHVEIQETMRAMETLVSQGKVRYIGVSNFSAEQVREAQESLSKYEIAANQVRYSITARSIEDTLLPFCEKEKITIIAYSPLDRGRIAQSKIPSKILSTYGMTPAQVMLNWVTYNKSVIAIPKAAQAKHVEEDAESLKTRLSSQDYETLSKIFG